MAKSMATTTEPKKVGGLIQFGLSGIEPIWPGFVPSGLPGPQNLRH